MGKSKTNANQQNQRQQTMADNNQASTSSSLPPKKDKHIAKRPKKGPPPPVTPKDIATVTEFDISDIRATYGPKTPLPTGKAPHEPSRLVSRLKLFKLSRAEPHLN